MNLRELLPDRPAYSNEQMEEWLWCNGTRGREVLTYRKTRIRNPLTGLLEPVAHCKCSVCEQEWNTKVFGYRGSYPEFENMDGIRCNGERTTCPECGAELEAAYYTRLKKHPIISTHYPWEVVKKDSCIMFICWALVYEIDDMGGTVYPEKRNAYVLDQEGKWHRFTAMERSGWSSMSRMVYCDRWYEMNKFQISDGRFSYRFPVEQGVFAGTQLENAKMEELEQADRNADLLMYARLYMRHKNVENITMNSPKLMAHILHSMWGVSGLDWLNWKAAKPHEILYMEKPEYLKAKVFDIRQAFDMLKQKKQEAACILWGISKEYASTLGEVGTEFAFKHKNDKVLRQFGLVRIWNYILKVDGKKGCTSKTLSSTITLCEDYWKDMVLAGLDVRNSVVVFPKDVKEAHARAIQAIKYKEDEKLQVKFRKIYKQLEGLTWEKDGLMIVPAQSESELIAEGKILQHCVGGYAEAHCEGRSIFFIRKVDKPDVPYFTLQMNTKTGLVLQNRGLKNCDRTEKVRAFETQWLADVVKPWLEKKKNKATERMNRKTKDAA